MKSLLPTSTVLLLVEMMCLAACHKEHTGTCIKYYQRCPSSCRKLYDLEKNCFICHCQIGEPGDTVVSVDSSCPLQMYVRERGNTTKACAFYSRIPIGDTKVCGTNPTCSAGCHLLRVENHGGCIYCQCGLLVRPGDITVPAGDSCPSGFVVRDRKLDRLSCKRSTSEEDWCIPGTIYKRDCNTCECIFPRMSRCTLKHCAQKPADGVQDCDNSSACPADCAQTLNITGNCYTCKCSEDVEGDIIVPKGQPCPHGTMIRQIRSTTKACKPAEAGRRLISISKPEPDCFSKKDRGSCRAYLEMFAFNPYTRRCEKFIYGGCSGNANRYETEQACLRTCATTTDDPIY